MKPTDKQIEALIASIREQVSEANGWDGGQDGASVTVDGTFDAAKALEAALSAQDGAVGVKGLPRNEGGVRGWLLDPEMVREVTDNICRDGWEAAMEEVELAMLEAEKRILASSPSPAQEAPISYQAIIDAACKDLLEMFDKPRDWPGRLRLYKWLWNVVQSARGQFDLDGVPSPAQEATSDTKLSRVLANPCVQKLQADEPFFVLLGRDKHAAAATRAWVSSREAERGISPKTTEAREIADAMDAYAGESFPAQEAGAEPVAAVERVECVSYENGYEEPADPTWRIVLDEYCADFVTEMAAQNFADAINRRASPPLDRGDEWAGAIEIITDLGDTFARFLDDINHGQESWQRDQIARARRFVDTLYAAAKEDGQ